MVGLGTIWYLMGRYVGGGFKGLLGGKRRIGWSLISSGTLKAFFMWPSIGFIGHVLDEKRLAMPMYRNSMG